MTDPLAQLRRLAPGVSGDSLLEAWGDVVPTFDDMWGQADVSSGAISRYQRPATTVYDRADGRFLPVYQTEFDLAVIRSMGRTLASISAPLIGGLRNLCNYTIGKGFSFTASREPMSLVTDEGARPLIRAVQREINRILDDNDFVSAFDREIHDASIVDGEALLHITATTNGKIRITRREPDELREPMQSRDLEDWVEEEFDIPCSAFETSWTFGILTRKDSPDEPLAYHFVSDDAGVNYDVVPARQVVHIKRNVPRNAKRGFSDFYPIEGDSTRGYKLKRNMTEGATARSAIVFIRQHIAGATRTGVENMLGENRAGSARLPGGSHVNLTRLDRPRIFDISNGLEYKSPPSAEETADFLLVAKEVQRQQAVRWAMPEYMFTGDASNANYSSTMEATSPFVKSCEGEQRFYAKHFVAVVWKALRIRWEMGAFGDVPWELLESTIKIKADCPEVATRDELAVAQRQQLQISMGILSRKTAATQSGLDYAAELANGASSPDEQGQASQQGSPPAPPADASPSNSGPTADDFDQLLNGDPAVNVAAGNDPDQPVVPMTEAELLECGGKGGKPGPCKKATSAKKAPPKPKYTSFRVPDAPPRPPRPEQLPNNHALYEKKLYLKYKHEATSADIQRYAENYVERHIAHRLGGTHLRDNEPMDVVIHDKHGKVLHGIEAKTLTGKKAGFEMTPEAEQLKTDWSHHHQAPVHTIVYDDRRVFNVCGRGCHDYTKRVVYYKRGHGSFSIKDMQKVKNTRHLVHLMNLPSHELKDNARPAHTPARLRGIPHPDAFKAPARRDNIGLNGKPIRGHRYIDKSR